jgi:hypothetical protein
MKRSSPLGINLARRKTLAAGAAISITALDPFRFKD